MRKIREERILIVLILLVVIWIGFLYGCSAIYHEKKFYEKGGTFNCENDTIWKKDTTYLNGKIVIDSFPIPCDCGKVETPKTIREIKWKYKYLAKHERDSLNHNLKLLKERNDFIKDSLENDRKVRKINSHVAIKQDNNDRKTDTQWSKTINLVLWVGLVLIILFILAKIFKRFF